jgi:hypothetical protein
MLPISLLLVVIVAIVPIEAMHRADKSKYFLFIEPDARKKSSTPNDDELTLSLQAALAQSEKGTSDYTNLKDTKGKFTAGAGYRGFHFCEDGETSDVYDYRLPNGLITNSVSVHYVRFYRDQIPDTEMAKLKDLHQYMQKHKKDESSSSDL